MDSRIRGNDKIRGNPGASRINQTIIKLVPNCTGKCGNDS